MPAGGCAGGLAGGAGAGHALRMNGAGAGETRGGGGVCGRPTSAVARCRPNDRPGLRVRRRSEDASDHPKAITMTPTKFLCVMVSTALQPMHMVPPETHAHVHGVYYGPAWATIRLCASRC